MSFFVKLNLEIFRIQTNFLIYSVRKVKFLLGILKNEALKLARLIDRIRTTNQLSFSSFLRSNSIRSYQFSGTINF